MALRNLWIFAAALIAGASSMLAFAQPELAAEMQDRIAQTRAIEGLFAEVENRRTAGDCARHRDALARLRDRLDTRKPENAALIRFPDQALPRWRERLAEAEDLSCPPQPPPPPVTGAALDRTIQRMGAAFGEASSARTEGRCEAALAARDRIRATLDAFRGTGIPRQLMANWRNQLAAEEALPCARREPVPTASAACPRAFPAGTTSLSCRCPPGPHPGSVRGTYYYAPDTALCQAAIHAGAVSSQGGSILARAGPGRSYYLGTTRNGVTSLPAGTYERSFTFAGVSDPEERRGRYPLCRAALVHYTPAERQAPITCRCLPSADFTGAVYGSGPYTADSSICTAAVHAGALRVPEEGQIEGIVTVTAGRGLDNYPPSRRNGVSSQHWSAFPVSMTIVRGPL